MTYVAKGTPQGYDVNTAIDYLQSFNSSWPLLKVESTGIYSGAVNHDLGYYPFYTMVSTFTPGAFDQFAGLSDTYGVSASQLIRGSGSGNPRYYIFRLNLQDNFTAPHIDGDTTQLPSVDNYQFKISKDGKNIKSNDMRDYSLHSGARSPMVHLVSNGTTTFNSGTSSRERTVNHNLGYVPTAFAFVKPGAGSSAPGLTNENYYILPPPVGVSGGYYEVNSTTVYVNLDSFFFGPNAEVSIVVLKDPFNKKVINRTYP